jgi:hypothetical protein
MAMGFASEASMREQERKGQAERDEKDMFHGETPSNADMASMEHDTFHALKNRVF